MSWSIFTNELLSYHDDKNTTFFSQLVNLKQKGPVFEHIQQFQKLSLIVKDISNENLLDLFMGTLKESIQNDVCFFEPRSLEHTFKFERKDESINVVIRRIASNTYREHYAYSNPLNLKG